MELKKLTCSVCGANLEEKGSYFVCPYCQTRYAKVEEVGQPPKTKNQLMQEEGKKRIAEETEKIKKFQPGTYLFFGSYPQMRKSDDPSAKKTDDGFCYNPILWQVLEYQSGVMHFAVLLSSRILDAKEEAKVKGFLQPSNPAEEDDSFLSLAFSKEERRAIRPYKDDKRVCLPSQGEGPGNLTLYSYQKMQGRGFKNRAYWIEGETGLKRFPNGTEVILGIRPVIRVEIAFLTGMDIHPLSEKEVEEHENKVEEELDSFLQLEVNEDHVLRHVRGALPKRFEVPEGVREIDPKAFYDATGKMETIVLPKSLKNFPAFESKLTFLRRIEVDPENPFYSSLDGILYDKERTAVLRVPMAYPERVQLPKSVEEIREFSFAFSTILKGIEFPASCKTIRAHAFFNARIMTKLILPPSLKYIEQYAFCGATLNRQPLFIPRTVSWIGANAFENLKEGDLLFQSKKSLFGFPRGYDKRMLGQPPIENVKWAVDK